jgi:cytochrome oxidase assembly protein ShyY1
VLVNRGFVPLGTAPPPPPTGTVDVVGTVRPSQGRRTGELTDSGLAVTEVRRIDIDQLAPQLPGEVAPVYLDLVSSEPPVQSTDPAPVPPPELSEGNHLSYAGQWLIFAVCVAIGWVFAVRRSIRSRRSASTDDRDTAGATDDHPESDDHAVLTAEGAAPGPADSAPPAVDEATTGTT